MIANCNANLYMDNGFAYVWLIVLITFVDLCHVVDAIFGFLHDSHI